MIDALDMADLIRGAELARTHVALTDLLDAIYPLSGASWIDYAAALVHGLHGRPS